MKLSCLGTGLLVLTIATFCKAGELKSGLYLMSWEGEGRLVSCADTDGQFVLREHLSDQLREPALVSTRNDNSQFRLSLVAGPVPDGAGKRPLAVVIAGYAMPVSSHSDPRPDGSVSISATVQGRDTAQAIAAELNIKPHLRTHPGHQLLVSYEPEQTTYPPGEPVTLTMTITNIGQTTVRFMDGGSQRGPRNNQFAFIASPALPDVGDPTNFGGLARLVTLSPHETFTKDVTLTDWFQFDQSRTHQITGIYRLTLIDETQGDYFRSQLWDDFAVGTCLVRITAPDADEP